MMKTLLLRALALFFFAGLPVAAEIIGVETFDYEDGALAGQAGGTFWDYKNTAPAGRSGTASAWSNLNGAPNVTSGQLVTSGNGVVRRAYNGSNESDGAISDANVAKTVYYRVNVTTGPSVTAGDYFGISSVDGGTEVFYFGKRGGFTAWGVEQVGVSGTNGTLAIQPNQTYTLVAQVDLPGNAIRLYVNPNLNSPQSGPFNASTALAASQAYNGTAASTGVRFAAGTAVRWENLVVTTTWEELRLTVVTTLEDEDDGASALFFPNDISLREAVNHSPPDSTILFAPALNGQTCTLSTGSEIDVTKSLTLDASSLSSGLTIDGGTGTNRLFFVNSGASLTLRGLTLTGGNGTGTRNNNLGGAIFNAGTLTLKQCTLSGNSTSSNFGGAINNLGGTLTLMQCALFGNSAITGGAISNTGTLTLTQCALSGNSAGSGGAIASDTNLNTSTTNLIHCTLTGNTASTRGGAVYNRDGRTTLLHCTITGNTAPAGHGSGVASFGDAFTETLVKNTLISGNGGSSVDMVQGSTNSFTSQGGNLIGSGNATGDFNQSGDVFNDTPMLSPLGYFGGPVQTMHPLIGSPAIDAIVTSDPGGTDARGFPRFEDGSDTLPGRQLDIGAVEAGITLSVTLANDFGGSGTLRTRLANAAIFGNGTRIVFDPAVFPATPITLNGNQLTPPAGQAIFIDASNIPGGVTISGGGNSRVFNIPATATVAMHLVRIVNGKTPVGADGSSIAFGGGDGGGILNAGNMSLFSCTLSGNATGNGGFGENQGGGGGNGGGIFSSGSLSLTACAITGNATGNGGGSFSGGGSGGNGGGIFSSGSLRLTACSLSGNATGKGGNNEFTDGGGSGGSGGSIFQQGAISYRLSSCTITGNQTGIGGTGDTVTAPSGFGGGLSGGSVLLENCLIGLNTRGGGTPDDVNVSAITYVGGNQLGTAATVTGAATGAPTFVETPSIRALGDYGGPTQTMALQPNSRARNAGTVTARSTDQRGFPIVGAPDLGAFEGQIGAITDVSLIEGATPPTRTFPVGQIGALTAASSNTTLVPEENIVITGSGASRSVTVTPAAGQRGICIITLTEDLHGEQQTFQVEVTEDTRFIVTTSGDLGAGSLRNALSLAASTAGTNTIRFAPEVTAIALATQILVNDTEPVLVDASALSGGLVLNAGPNSRHFRVEAGASLTLRNMTLQDGNITGHGGSVISSGTLILERCRLMNNRCTSRGGAVESAGPVFRAVDCSFTNNSASLSGGALGYRNGIVELTRCTFAGNTATTGAAVISELVSQPAATVGTFLQCTFANNTASNPGSTGGIEVSFGTLNLIHCTVSQNTGIGATGGLRVSGTDVTITHCIIAGNTSTGGGAADILLSGGTLTPRGANLIGSNQGVEAVFSAGPLVGTAAAPRDPVLESFNLYGGTTFTMPPRVGSPALDQATVLDPALTTDQRGLPRPLGIRPDLGAVEASIIVVTTPVDELDPLGSPGNGVSLREAVGDLPAGGAIDFDRAIFGGATAYTLTLTQGPLNPPRNGLLFNSANPNGIRIGYVATFTQQPQSQSVAQGATATFSVGVMNINGGLAYDWRKDGFGEAITPSLSISNAQESNEGVYHLVLSEAFSGTSIVPANSVIFPVSITPFSGVSQPASLIVGGAPIGFQRQPAHAMLALGSNHTLSVVAVGPATPALTYQWQRNNVNIAGATRSTHSITNAQLTHAGAYRCLVRSGTTGVQTPSSAAEIGVVDTRLKTVNLAVGGTFTPSVSAAGNGLSYAWFFNGDSLSVTSKLIAPIKPVGPGVSGLYTCVVTGPGGSITTGCNTRLNVSAIVPTLATPLRLPPATIGESYFYQLPVQNIFGAPATSFSVTGVLPTGIVLNTTTGILSGRPTVTRTGGYALSFKVGNTKGFGQPAPATLTVNVVPPTAVGTFAGPMPRSPLNDNLGGRFDLVTTAAGGFSGSLTLGGRAKLSFTAQLLRSAGVGDVILYGSIPGLTMADKTPLTAYIEVFAAEQLARLTLLHPNGTTLLATAWRNSWLLSKTPALNNPATAYAARYHLRMDAGIGSSAAPEGYGFASFTVSSAGALTLAGRLPDGSAVTGGTFVGPEGQVLVFHLLYGNRGSQVGQFQITKAAAVVDNGVPGTTSWLKPGPLPRSTDTVYKEGFGPLTVTMRGGVYVAPAKGAVVSGFTAVTADQTNARLTCELGGLTAAFSQLLRIANPSATGLNNIAVLATPITNSMKITSFNASTGAFSGSFIVPGASPALNRPASFFGQLVKIGATRKGYGYFLLPQVPVGAEKVSTAPKLSGSVVLEGL